MMEAIRKEIKQTILDWGKYMNVSTPKGLNTDKFIDLHYKSNDEKREFIEKHDVDIRLLEDIAVYELFRNNSCEEVLRKCNSFKEIIR